MPSRKVSLFGFIVILGGLAASAVGALTGALMLGDLPELFWSGSWPQAPGQLIRVDNGVRVRFEADGTPMVTRIDALERRTVSEKRMGKPVTVRYRPEYPMHAVADIGQQHALARTLAAMLLGLILQWAGQSAFIIPLPKRLWWAPSTALAGVVVLLALSGQKELRARRLNDAPYERRLGEYLEGVARDPRDPIAIRVLGAFYGERHQPEAAVFHLSRALEQRPNDAAAHRERAEASP